MKVLDDASVRGNIKPFAAFVADCARHEPLCRGARSPAKSSPRLISTRRLAPARNHDHSGAFVATKIGPLSEGFAEFFGPSGENSSNVTASIARAWHAEPRVAPSPTCIIYSVSRMSIRTGNDA